MCAPSCSHLHGGAARGLNAPLLPAPLTQRLQHRLSGPKGSFYARNGSFLLPAAGTPRALLWYLLEKAVFTPAPWYAFHPLATAYQMALDH